MGFHIEMVSCDWILSRLSIALIVLFVVERRWGRLIPLHFASKQLNWKVATWHVKHLSVICISLSIWPFKGHLHSWGWQDCFCLCFIRMHQESVWCVLKIITRFCRRWRWQSTIRKNMELRTSCYFLSSIWILSSPIYDWGNWISLPGE